jgi:hypothetical protein
VPDLLRKHLGTEINEGIASYFAGRVVLLQHGDEGWYGRAMKEHLNTEDTSTHFT